MFKGFLAITLGTFLQINALYLSGSQSSEHEKDGFLIKRMILLSDVDGVIRESVEDRELSTEMLEALEALLNTQKVEIAFISGSPCVKKAILYPWQEDNISLYEIFYHPLKKWIDSGSVTLFGAQGGQTLSSDGICRIDEEFLFSNHEKENLFSSFIGAYYAGTSAFQPRKEWVAAAEEIFCLDQGFRLIDRGCEIEMQTTCKECDIERAREYLALSEPNAVISAGVASRGENFFSFIKVSRMSKEIGAKKYLLKKNLSEGDANTLIVAFGDTQTDVGLYRVASYFGGLSFHFGKDGDYEGSPLIVRSESGCDNTHTNGAVQILKLLQEKIKPLSKHHLPAESTLN